MAEKHPNAQPIGVAPSYVVDGPIGVECPPDARAVVLSVLAGSRFPDGGRVLSDHDANVLAGRVVAALRATRNGRTLNETPASLQDDAAPASGLHGDVFGRTRAGGDPS